MWALLALNFGLFEVNFRHADALYRHICPSLGWVLSSTNTAHIPITFTLEGLIINSDASVLVYDGQLVATMRIKPNGHQKLGRICPSLRWAARSYNED